MKPMIASRKPPDRRIKNNFRKSTFHGTKPGNSANGPAEGCPRKHNGNTPPEREPLPRDTVLSTPLLGTTATPTVKPIRWLPRRQPLGGNMTCWATYGSGRRIGSNPHIRPENRKLIRQDQKPGSIACCGAALGTMFQSSRAPRFVTTTVQRIRTAILGSGAGGKLVSLDSFSFFLDPLAEELASSRRRSREIFFKPRLMSYSIDQW